MDKIFRLLFIVAVVFVSGCAQTPQDNTIQTDNNQTGTNEAPPEEDSSEKDESLTTRFDKYDQVAYSNDEISLVVDKETREYELWVTSTVNLSKVVSSNPEYDSKMKAAKKMLQKTCQPLQKKSFGSGSLNKVPGGHKDTYDVSSTGKDLAENHTVETKYIKQLLESYEPRKLSYSIRDTDIDRTKAQCIITDSSESGMETNIY